MGQIITNLSDICGKRPAAKPPSDNFHRVDDKVYRGAQPKVEGFYALKDLGVTTVIDLREDNWADEQPLCNHIGIAYNNIPLDPFAAPTIDSLINIFGLIEKSEGKVFIHCQYGCDRTGTVIALYRITKGATNQAALEEAVNRGLSEWETGMKEFIKTFKPEDLK